MGLLRMIRVRPTFPRPRVADIPRAVAATLGEAALRIRRGDTVAVGAGSRGIANIGAIVGAAVRWLRDLGARPFVFPAMGSHGGGTAEGQLSVLEHYGITEATMGCPIRATMDVVQVGEALGLPVWLDAYAAEADWIGVVNRVKPHTDFKGSIESGLFRSEEHTSELQSRSDLVCRLLLEKKKKKTKQHHHNTNKKKHTKLTV